jgi:hypothetical protein
VKNVAAHALVTATTRSPLKQHACHFTQTTFESGAEAKTAAFPHVLEQRRPAITYSMTELVSKLGSFFEVRRYIWPKCFSAGNARLLPSTRSTGLHMLNSRSIRTTTASSSNATAVSW